jgi:hypothetical protein
LGSVPQTLQHEDGSKGRATVTDRSKTTILVQLKDLHRLAAVARSYYLAGRCERDASNEITALRKQLNLPT